MQTSARLSFVTLSILDHHPITESRQSVVNFENNATVKSASTASRFVPIGERRYSLMTSRKSSITTMLGKRSAENCPTVDSTMIGSVACFESRTTVVNLGR